MLAKWIKNMGSTSNNNVQALLKWLGDSDDFYLNPNVEVYEDRVTGRGIRLKNGTLHKNDTVVSVPSSHQLNFITVLHWIRKFTDNETVDPDIEAKQEVKTGSKDPRYRAYRLLKQDTIQEMNSFQLLCLFIIAEWLLLPRWSNNMVFSWWKPFFDIFPSDEEMSAIPTKWALLHPEGLRGSFLKYLPTASMRHTERLSELLKNDWVILKPILQQWKEEFAEVETPSLEELWSQFVYIYFVINSRCLYMEIPMKTDIKDHFTMVPFVDYLNHTNEVDVHCFPRVNNMKKHEYGIGEFSIHTGNHEYSIKFEELLLNYGAHSNDFLLNEYGFTTLKNRWDYIDLTPEISTLFEDSRDIDFLNEIGYWGDFTISEGDISYRILVALSLLCCKDRRKTEKFALGYISEELFEPKTSLIIKKILTNVKQKYLKILDDLKTIEAEDWCRWNLINLYESYKSIIESNL